jgi:hypothetical protein
MSYPDQASAPSHFGRSCRCVRHLSGVSSFLVSEGRTPCRGVHVCRRHPVPIVMTAISPSCASCSSVQFFAPTRPCLRSSPTSGRSLGSGQVRMRPRCDHRPIYCLCCDQYTTSEAYPGQPTPPLPSTEPLLADCDLSASSQHVARALLGTAGVCRLYADPDFWAFNQGMCEARFSALGG